MSDKTKLSDDLHDAIMRLPCNAVAVEFSSQELRAYKEGHRDACQAAAELAASHATDAPAHGEQEAKLLADQVSAWKAEIARLEGMVAYATGTPPSEQKPVAWRDALRRCGANTDYHGLIAFTGAQLEQFVGMLATPAASPVASIPTWQERYAEARSNLTAPRIPAGLAEECKDAEIADLRAALAGAPVASDPKKAPGTRDDFNIISNARSLLSKTRSDQTKNWVLAMDMFAVGSTSAHKICRDAGIDPDATVVARAALAKMEGA